MHIFCETNGVSHMISIGWTWLRQKSDSVSVCGQHMSQWRDSSDSYRAVLQKRLPHVGGEPFVGVARHVGGHDGVIDEGREVSAHGGQVTAVRQPWWTQVLIS